MKIVDSGDDDAITHRNNTLSGFESFILKQSSNW